MIHVAQLGREVIRGNSIKGSSLLKELQGGSAESHFLGSGGVAGNCPNREDALRAP